MAEAKTAHAKTAQTEVSPNSGLGLEYRPATHTKWGTPPYRTDSSYGPGSAIVNWEGAHLNNADLRWQNFRGATLKGAKLEGAILWGATLKNANLNNADLSHADLTGADLAGADLSDTKFDGACFLGARYNQETRFPEGFGDPKSKGCVNLTEAMQLNFN